MKQKGRAKVVEEVAWGMYVWELPSGEVLGDGEGNIMNCFVWERKDRAAAKKAITAAANSYGFGEGRAVWWSGQRPINDDELARQIERADQGLTPDPLDIASFNEDTKNMETRRRGN
jgi:hypothetical protein